MQCGPKRFILYKITDFMCCAIPDRESSQAETLAAPKESVE